LDRVAKRTTSVAPEDPKTSGDLRHEPAALDENVEVIKSWEQEVLLARSRSEQVADWIANTAVSGPVLLLHVLSFAFWIAANVGLIPGIDPFDPFPFPLLTVALSLEAIFLTLFVLASQSRLTRQHEKRSHLNLQIDLLAEREMTAVLRLLQDIGRHLNVSTSVTPDQLRDLAKQTDVRGLTHKMDEIAEPESPPECPDDEDGAVSAHSVALGDGDSGHRVGEGRKST
jgi:uncharacterized membrane protein